MSEYVNMQELRKMRPFIKMLASKSTTETNESGVRLAVTEL